MLAELGIDPGPSCPCRRRMRQMDEWGVDGCREHREEIVGWLREGQERYGWGARITAGWRTVVSGLAWRINPGDPLGSLVDEAVRRAEATAAA